MPITAEGDSAMKNAPASEFATTHIDLTALSVFDDGLTRSESKSLKNDEQRNAIPRMLGDSTNCRRYPAAALAMLRAHGAEGLFPAVVPCRAKEH